MDTNLPFTEKLDFSDSSHVSEFKWMFLFYEREKARDPGVIHPRQHTGSFFLCTPPRFGIPLKCAIEALFW